MARAAQRNHVLYIYKKKEGRKNEGKKDRRKQKKENILSVDITGKLK